MLKKLCLQKPLLLVLGISGLLTMQPLLGGSLFNEDEYDSLVSDQRSYKVGDILTVMIYEAATASTKTQTDTKKGTSIGAKGSDGTNSIEGNIGINSEFGGGGTSSQTGKLVASVSVTVIETLPNGDMKVKGNQTLEFNSDMQHIAVSGIVRKEDIESNNTVLSSRLADAEIKFVGEGLLTSRAKPGVLTKLWNWLF